MPQDFDLSNKQFIVYFMFPILFISFPFGIFNGICFIEGLNFRVFINFYLFELIVCTFGFEDACDMLLNSDLKFAKQFLCLVLCTQVCTVHALIHLPKILVEFLKINCTNIDEISYLCELKLTTRGILLLKILEMFPINDKSIQQPC